MKGPVILLSACAQTHPIYAQNSVVVSPIVVFDILDVDVKGNVVAKAVRASHMKWNATQTCVIAAKQTTVSVRIKNFGIICTKIFLTFSPKFFPPYVICNN